MYAFICLIHRITFPPDLLLLLQLEPSNNSYLQLWHIAYSFPYHFPLFLFYSHSLKTSTICSSGVDTLLISSPLFLVLVLSSQLEKPLVVS